MQNRITIDLVDHSRPIAEWKHKLADRGKRRHMSYSLDFDTRAYLLEEPGDNWDEASRKMRLESRERTRLGLAREFGEDFFDDKVANFIAIGVKPFSIISYHNALFDQTRRSFVMGAYYPALLGACALGERILNHLILDLREFYRNTAEYKVVARKDSFVDWGRAIETLETWNVLLPTSAREFRALMPLRHRSVHFNASTYNTLRDDALAAVLHVREIIEQQFTAFGDRPWFIKGTKGLIFIKREWENNPFIRAFYLPTCPYVGPHVGISLLDGIRFYDKPDYGEGDWTDEEFAAAYEARTIDDIVQPSDR